MSAEVKQKYSKHTSHEYFPERNAVDGEIK